MPFFRCCAFALGMSAFGIACADETSVKKTPTEIISVTESNLRGHKSLYHEGWFVVSSTEKAFSYTREHAITSSGQAMSRAIADAGGHSTEYGKNLVEAGKGGVQTGAKVYIGGTDLSKQKMKSDIS